MFIGPRKSQGKPKAKGYFNVSMKFQRLRFMLRGKALNAASDSYSTSNELLPGHIDSTKESNLDGFPEALTNFDPHEYKLSEFAKRFRTRRTRDRSRNRRSGAPSVESVKSVESEVREKSYKEIE